MFRALVQDVRFVHFHGVSVQYVSVGTASNETLTFYFRFQNDQTTNIYYF